MAVNPQFDPKTKTKQNGSETELIAGVLKKRKIKNTRKVKRNAFNMYICVTVRRTDYRTDCENKLAFAFRYSRGCLCPTRGGEICELVSWRFEPSQSQRITSGLNTNFILSHSYSFRKS